MPTDLRYRCRGCGGTFRLALADAPGVCDCPRQDCDGHATADAKVQWSSRTGYQRLEVA